MATAFRVLIRWSSGRNSSSYIRPDNTDLYIQDCIGIYKNKTNGVFDFGDVNYSAFFELSEWNTNLCDLDLASSIVYVPKSYRGYFHSLVVPKELVSNSSWDHNFANDPFFYEDGRSIRAIIAGGKHYRSLVSIPISRAYRPFKSYTILWHDDFCHYVTCTSEVFSVSEKLICELMIVVIHGSNSQVPSDRNNLRLDTLNLMDSASKLYDHLVNWKKNYDESSCANKRKVIREFVIIICKNSESDVFLLDPKKFVNYHYAWNMLQYEDGISDPYGEPGYWAIVGFKCSDSVVVKYRNLGIDDKSAISWTIRYTHIDRIVLHISDLLNTTKSIFRRYFVESIRNKNRKFYVKLDFKDAKSGIDVKAGSLVSRTMYETWSSNHNDYMKLYEDV